MPVAHLDDRAVVRIAGPDAHTFLQNVVTLDIEKVDAHGSGYGALLTPQGKILWDFVLHRLPDGYAADVRAEEAEAFAKRLSLYKLRAKVEIAAAPELAVFAAGATSPRQGRRAADPRLRCDRAGAGWRPSARAATDAPARTGIATASRSRCRKGGVDFVFGDAFPSDAAMDSLAGVAFDKGCFIGQEVVSRMRHRGTGAAAHRGAQKRTARCPSAAPTVIAGERPLGRLGSSADGHGIAVVRLDRLRAALDAGTAVNAGGERSSRLSPPEWATYGWPETASGGGGVDAMPDRPGARRGPGSACCPAAGSTCSTRRRSTSRSRTSRTGSPAWRAGTGRRPASMPIRWRSIRCWWSASCASWSPRRAPRDRLAALLHDAPEYVIGDMISPFKAVIDAAYREVEARLATAVRAAFRAAGRAAAGAMRQRIKKADQMAAYWEAVRLAGFAEAEALRYFGRPGKVGGEAIADCSSPGLQNAPNRPI